MEYEKVKLLKYTILEKSVDLITIHSYLKIFCFIF